jgi:hypothetical protein
MVHPAAELRISAVASSPTIIVKHGEVLCQQVSQMFRPFFIFSFNFDCSRKPALKP